MILLVLRGGFLTSLNVDGPVTLGLMWENKLSFLDRFAVPFQMKL